MATQHLLELTLYNSGGTIPAVDLSDRVGEVAGLDAPLSGEMLKPALDWEIEMGRIVENAGALSLTVERSTLIKAAHEKAASDERHFLGHVVDEVSKHFDAPLNALAEQLIAQSVAKVIIECARRGQYALQDTATRIANNQGAPLFDASECLAGEMTVVSSAYQVELRTLLLGVRAYFSSLDEDCKRHIQCIYHKVFCHQLLNFDPALYPAQQEALSSTKLYLDTNIVVDYLLGHQSETSDATCEILDASRDLGIQLLVSPATVSELTNLRDSASRQSGLLKDGRLRAVITARPGHRTNPFILGYINRSLINKGLTWAGYVAPYKDLEQALLGKEVLPEEQGSEELEKDPDYGTGWDKMRSVKHQKPDFTVAHDVKNFILVKRLRERHKGNVLFGPSVWLITRDSALRNFDLAVSDQFQVPHSQHIDLWGERLLPLQTIHGFVATDYVAHLLQARFGVVPDSDGVDLDFVSMLNRVEFDMETILTLEPAHAAQVLINLQSDAQAFDLTTRAAASESPEERAELTRDISNRALAITVDQRDTAIRSGQKMSARIGDLEAIIEVLSADARAAEIRASQLEGRVDAVESEGFLKRLLRVFRPRT